MATDNSNQQISAFEAELARLHRVFEQYFLGIERLAPINERDDLKRRLLRFRGEMGRASTAVRFRANTLWQRFTSYDQMWTRTLKQIEEGTYHRDVQKAKRRAKHYAALGQEDPLSEGAKGKPSETPAAAAPAAAAAAAQAARRDGGLSDAQISKIYDTYLMARKRTGESGNISKATLARQLRQRAQSLSEQHACDGVAFKIVIKGGKALIKAQPKR